MGWTAPRTWVAGEIVTASIMNSAVRDNLLYIKGVGQVPTIESGLTIDNTDGDERLLLPLLSTAECSTVLNAEGEVAFDEQTHQMKEYDGTAVRAIISEADVDDTPVNSATTVPISSNWAYDHITDADQHPEYQKESLLTTEGDMVYATGASAWARLAKGTAYQLIRMNAGATAPEWGPQTGITMTRKTADESVNNSTVLQNDNHLLLSVGSNEVYWVMLYLRADYTIALDIYIDIAWTIPVAAAMYRTDANYQAVDTAGNEDNATAEQTVSGLSTTTKGILLEYLYVGGANAGTIQLQWAMNTAVETDLNVRTNSFLTAYKLS